MVTIAPRNDFRCNYFEILKKKMTTKNKIEADKEIKLKLIETVAQVLMQLIRYGVLGFVFFELVEAVKLLAGKETSALIDLPFLNGNVLGLIFGGGASIYGYKQRKVSNEKSRRDKQRIEELENKLRERP